MFDISIKSKDLPEIIELLKRYPEMTNDNIAEVFKFMLPEITRYAKMEVPVDTGRLKTDIGYKFSRRLLEGIVYNDVEYSIFVHEGTQHMAARPYIYNAIFNKSAIRMKREIQRNLLKEKRGLL